jgi:phytoene synthase
MTAETAPAALQAQVSGSSFYAGMRVLPKPERHAMYAIYAFCRAVDDIADDQQGDRGTRAEALDAWRRGIDALYDGGDTGLAAYLAEAVAAFRLGRDDFHAVIDGMQTDVDGDVRWPPAAALDLYCDRVASAVGRLSVRVFGMDEAPGIALAFHLGRALQLTNILRDIDEDAAIGRVYLPYEGLTAAGVPLTTPAEVVAHPGVDKVARTLAAEAQDHFAKAQAILSARPRGHLIAPRLMAAAYSRLLARMETTGWMLPRHRARVSKLRLLFTILRLSLTR